MTNDEMNDLVEVLFLDFLEGRSITFDIDAFSSNEITLIFAKLAAKFASYAGDGKDF